MNKWKALGITGIVLGSVGLAGLIGGSVMLGISTNQTYEKKLSTLVKEYIKGYNYGPKISYENSNGGEVKGLNKIKIRSSIASYYQNVEWYVNNQLATSVSVDSYDPYTYVFDTNESCWRIGNNCIRAKVSGKCSNCQTVKLFNYNDLSLDFHPGSSFFEMSPNNYEIEQNETGRIYISFKVGDVQVSRPDCNLTFTWKIWNESTASWDNYSDYNSEQLYIDGTLPIGHYKFKVDCSLIPNVKVKSSLSSIIEVDVINKTSTIESINDILINNTNSGPIFVGEEVTFSADTTPAVEQNNWKYEWVLSNRSNDEELHFHTKTFKWCPKEVDSNYYYYVSLTITDGIKKVSYDKGIYIYERFNKNSKINLSLTLRNSINYIDGNSYILSNTIPALLEFSADTYDNLYSNSDITYNLSLEKYENGYWREISTSPNNDSYCFFKIDSSILTNSKVNKFRCKLIASNQKISITKYKELNVVTINNLKEIPDVTLSVGVGSMNWGQFKINNKNIPEFKEELKFLGITNYDDFVNGVATIKRTHGNDVVLPRIVNQVFNKAKESREIMIAGAVITGLFGILIIPGIALLVLWLVNKNKE